MSLAAERAGELREALSSARALIEASTILRPRIGVVLGSGLGAFAEGFPRRIAYCDLTGMPVSTVAGHAGYLCLGEVAGHAVACLQGRAHLYEGHSAAAVVYGVRLLAALGCEAVLLTNAAGGIAPSFAAGDFMLLQDHINLTGQTPLAGPNDDDLGPRFPDMSRVYDPELGELARRAAAAAGITLREGVYAGLLGPSYETPAEVRMLRTLGADAVGMSTVLEAIALRHRGVRAAAISCITNLAAGLSPVPLSHEEVQNIGRRTGPLFVELLTRWIALIGPSLPPRAAPAGPR